MALPSGFDPEGFQITDAQSTGQDIYEVQFPSWGVRTAAAGQAAVNPNFQFPPPGSPAIPLSLAGIALGPRSTVDRCWVSWNRQKAVGLAGPALGGFNQGVPTTRVRPMTNEHPLMFSQATAIGAVPTAAASSGIYDPNNSPTYAMQNGLLYVWPKEPTPYPGSDSGADVVCTTAQSTTIIPADYIDQNGTGRIFGSAPNGGNYYKPYLELYLYLRPPLFSPPTKRFPVLVSDVIPVTLPNTITPIDFIPIFGRKNITVTLAGRGAVFQLGLINCVCENSGGTTMPLEGTAGSAITPGADTSIIQIANPCADYLVVYANVSAAPTTVQVQVAAYD
jgi:hypothetical protein